MEGIKILVSEEQVKQLKEEIKKDMYAELSREVILEELKKMSNYQLLRYLSDTILGSERIGKMEYAGFDHLKKEDGAMLELFFLLKMYNN